MRIALVTTEGLEPGGGTGGLGHSARRLATVLVRAGHEVVWFAPGVEQDGFDAGSGAALRQVARPSGPFRSLVGRCTFHLLTDAWSAWSLGRRIRSAIVQEHRIRSFDLIHYSHLAGLAHHRLPGVPSMVRLSSWWPLWCEAGDGQPAGPAARLVHRLERSGLRAADLVYGPSSSLNAMVARELGVDVHQASNPYPPRDADGETVAARAGVRGGYVLTVGVGSRLKGSHFIADAMRMVMQGNADVRWIAAGRLSGGEPWSSWRTQLGPSASRFKHRGPLGNSEVAALMAGAVCVVVPSIIDNCPNVALEAAQRGAPLVVSETAGLADALGPDGAIFVPKADPRGFADAIMSILRDPAAARALAARADAAMRMLEGPQALGRFLDLAQLARQRAGKGELTPCAG